MSFAWLKSLTPRSLFARAALILLVPILTIQIVVSYVFIQRLYENVTTQMTDSMLPVIEYVIEKSEAAATPAARQTVFRDIARPMGLNVTLSREQDVVEGRRWFDLSGRVVARVIRGHFENVGPMDLLSNHRRVRFLIETEAGPMVFGFQRERVSASNPHQLLVLMVFVATIVTIISFLFLRNQVRPIRNLANAAAAFGKGHNASYKPSGATEVRQAGTAFLEMRARIERSIEQRTLMLSGVSHDLRTPLTRMRLSLGLLPASPEIEAMTRDVDEMQDMLDSFLEFAEIGASAARETVDPEALARRVVAKYRDSSDDVRLLGVEGAGQVELNALAIERALQNLIGNGLRYGDRVEVNVAIADRTVRFRVEDDGPGIPENLREEAMRPFARLDAARNQDRGGGVGLGLSIVRDIARQHGGTLRLDKSETMGGLQADIIVAR
jgi:two-component system osmolarity sensor histidine kinase EnvZ